MTSSSAFSCCLFVLLIGLVHSAPPIEPTSFECPENEYFVNCSLAVCQKTCRDFLVPPPCPGISSDCYQPACVCGEGYLRSDSGVCVPYRQCANALCSRRCRPTCSLPHPKKCKPDNHCECNTGAVWSDDRKSCVNVDDCPLNLGCNGDINAYIVEKPPPCPSTCASPNQTPCKKTQLDFGCVCFANRILSKEGGRCIRPEQCPGGNPCRGNQTFSYCRSENLNNYCPMDDRGIEVNDDPNLPCPSGCVCQNGYLRKSYIDLQCVLPEDCPPVICTRDNEEWNRCPSPCFTDSCSDAFRDKSVCNTFVEAECEPQCQCKKGFARNDGGKCVPIEECPKSEEEEEWGEGEGEHEGGAEGENKGAEEVD